MKKYLIFAVSFILLFSILVFSAQMLSGIFLTSAYAPDIEGAWNASAALPQKAEIIAGGSPFLLTLLLALLSASVAYFVSRKFAKRIHHNVE